MTASTLVSVVIPTVRIDGHLQESVSSILEQDYEPLEVVLVLDGADLTDLPSAWHADPRITVVHHETRRGTPLALNAGIAASRGDVIARLDADDIALPGRLKAQAVYLRDHPAVVCVGTQSILIDEHGVTLGQSTSSNSRSLKRDLLTRNPLVHSSVMYRANTVRIINGYSPEMHRMQDYELYLRMAKKGEIAILSEVLTGYRVHAKQFSRNTSPWQPYTRLLLRQRLALARYLGVPVLLQHARNAVWFLRQVARHHGAVRPGYVKSIAETAKPR